MANDDFILNFYKNLAKNHGPSATSSMQDETIRQVETDFILTEINDFIQRHEFIPKILELGCGNAYLLQRIQAQHPGISLTGLEFTPELCEIAQSRNIPHTQVFKGDMRKSEDYPGEFYDIVITQRSLINLGSWKEQEKVLEILHQKLRSPGLYICVESYMEPWINLNAARKEVRLPPLKPSVQNVYLKDKSRKLLRKWGHFKRPTKIPENALSPHFFNSRILHPLIRPQGARLKYTQTVKYLDENLTTCSMAYSPILLRSYEKMGSNLNRS